MWLEKEDRPLANKGDTYISVIGASVCNESVASDAYRVGTEIARSGCVLVSGGLTGVMESSCKGAHESRGTVLAVVPSSDRSEANRYADFVIASGIGHARNLTVAATGDVVIAVGGEWGTLSEIGHARTMGREVVLLSSWILDHSDLDIVGLHTASTPKEAVQQAVALAK